MLSKGSYGTRLSSNLQMVRVLSDIEMGQSVCCSFCSGTCGVMFGIMFGIMFADQHNTSHVAAAKEIVLH